MTTFPTLRLDLAQARRDAETVRVSAQAKASAEVDRITGRDRSAIDAAAAERAPLVAALTAAKKHRDELSGGRRDPETGKPIRARGVTYAAWEEALDAITAAELALEVLPRTGDLEKAWREFRPADLPAARRAAAEAFDGHLAALPIALTEAVEHVEALYALADLAGRPLSRLGSTSNPLDRLRTLVPDVVEHMRAAQAERDEFTRQVKDRVSKSLSIPTN